MKYGKSKVLICEIMHGICQDILKTEASRGLLPTKRLCAAFCNFKFIIKQFKRSAHS